LCIRRGRGSRPYALDLHTSDYGLCGHCLLAGVRRNT
jgi:hypothetical protein